MATIRKRGNSWHVQIRRTGFPQITGSFAHKQDALAWARVHEQTIDRGEIPPNSGPLSRVTVADLLLRYKTTVSATKRGADREGFKFRVLLRSPMAQRPLSSVSSAMLATYRDHRLTLVKPATVRRELALLRHCFEVARTEWGIGGENPFANVKLPAPTNSRDRRLEAGDAARLEQALKSSRVWYLSPMMELAIETGMRRGELLSLGWNDVDIPKRLAFLRMTKNGSRRAVPLTKRAAEVFSRLPRSEERVFPILPGTFGEAWERLVRRAGLTQLRFHDLRHEAISRFFEMGLSLPEVALISGHRDYRMLLRYTHLRPMDVVAKLDVSHYRR